MNITAEDFSQMTETEKEAFTYSVLGFTKNEMIRMVAEFESEEGKSPNAIMISSTTLYQFHKIGVKLKKLEYGPVKLVILPVAEADAQRFLLAQVDPWSPAWEHLFFS